MDHQKTIGNVNILNLMNATEESVSAIHQIGNANLVLFSPETSMLMNRLSFGNLNVTVEVPSGAQLVTKNGSMEINADFFKSIEQKVFLLVSGQVIIGQGLARGDIEKGLAGFAVGGQFACPEDLLGAFMTLPTIISGKTIAYPPFKHIVYSSLTLDTAFLNSLEEKAEISILGDLSLPKVLPNELLERKIGRLFVAGSILCHEENDLAIRSRLYKNAASFKTIPAGFEWVERALVLDADMLEYLPGKKLYCKELVQILPSVDPAAFDQRVDQLIAEDLLLCPSALRPVMARKCNLFDTKAIFYADELWLVQDEQTWQEARFNFLEGTATLVVSGELTIDPAVAPATLAGRLSKIHNFGLIHSTPEQRAALESRLGMREGAIEELSAGSEAQPQKEESQPGFIGNVNYLAL